VPEYGVIDPDGQTIEVWALAEGGDEPLVEEGSPVALGQGGSLRGRIDREGRLPVDEAVDLTARTRLRPRPDSRSLSED
jgi:hypothetical protein